MQERKLTKPEAKAKERIVKDLKGAKTDFKKRYGDDAEAVMYATATKRAKKIAEGIDPESLEKIFAILLMIIGPAGIYFGFEQLRKSIEGPVNSLIDRFYGNVSKAGKFLAQNAKELRRAAKNGKEDFEQKLSDLISGLHEDEGCGCSVCQSELDEKKAKRDRCLRIADRKFKKPSAYKSGAVVRCRKGKIWKGVKEDVLSEKEKESLRTWFKRKGAPGKTGGWVDCNSPIRKDGKITGYKPCGRQKGEKRKYPACRPTPARCKDPNKGKTWGKTKEQKIREVIQNVIKNTIE